MATTIICTLEAYLTMQSGTLACPVDWELQDNNNLNNASTAARTDFMPKRKCLSLESLVPKNSNAERCLPMNSDSELVGKKVWFDSLIVFRCQYFTTLLECASIFVLFTLLVSMYWITWCILVVYCKSTYNLEILQVVFCVPFNQLPNSAHVQKFQDVSSLYHYRNWNIIQKVI